MNALDNSQAFISHSSTLSGLNNKVYFGVKKASNPNVDALVLDLTPKKALLFGSYIATISNLTLRYDNNNFSYYTNQILVDQSTGDRAIVKQNFTSSTSTTFQDLINTGKIAIIPLGSRTPYPTLDNPDQNPLYNNANGFSVDSEIEYDGQVWVYISENAEGIPSWVIKEDVVNVSRSFGLVDEYANGTIIIVSNAIGMPNADYSANPIPANLFTKSFKANYIINDSQPVFDILDSNGNLVNQLPLEYLSSSENPIKNDDDLLLSNHNLGCTNQGDLNDALTSAITNKADKVANATAGHLASLDVNGNLADSGITASNVTTQGNSFNGENQLVKLNGSGKVPASTIPTTLTDLAEAGNNISLTLNPLTGKYDIASTGGGDGVADQGLKIASTDLGSDITGSGTYDNPYGTPNKTLETVAWNGICKLQPSSGGKTYNVSQIVVPEDTYNPSKIHWNKTLEGEGDTNNANRVELTFDNTSSNFLSLPNSNVRFNLVNLNFNLAANPNKTLNVLGGGGNNFQNLTFSNHTQPLTFDFTYWKSNTAFLNLTDISLAKFDGNLKFKNIPVGVSNIVVYLKGEGNTNLSLDTLQINALNPTATLTIYYSPTIILNQEPALMSLNANVFPTEIKDFLGFVATSSELTTRNYTGFYILSANISNVGKKGDLVLIAKIGTNVSICDGNYRPYAQCPNDLLNALTGVTYFKDAGYWVTLKEASLPAGTVMPFYGTTAPAGFLMLNGSTIVGGKATYSTLWAFAVASNITTTNMLSPQSFVSLNASDFKIPDFRGYFLRGLGGVDPDVATRTLGSVQADDFTSHGHVYISGRTFPGVNAGSGGYFGARYENDTSTTSSVGGAETRPKNIAMNFIIKF